MPEPFHLRKFRIWLLFLFQRLTVTISTKELTTLKMGYSNIKNLYGMVSWESTILLLFLSKKIVYWFGVFEWQYRYHVSRKLTAMLTDLHEHYHEASINYREKQICLEASPEFPRVKVFPVRRGKASAWKPPQNCYVLTIYLKTNRLALVYHLLKHIKWNPILTSRYIKQAY